MLDDGNDPYDENASDYDKKLWMARALARDLGTDKVTFTIHTPYGPVDAMAQEEIKNMPDKRFDIIMTVWNRKGYTARTLASLIDSGAVEACDRFIIVDNCSTEEGMYEAMDSIYKDTPGVSGKVFLLRRAKNDGWGVAVNDALGLSRAPYLLLINNDVEFKANFYERMLDAFHKQVVANRGRGILKGVGLVGAWRHTSHGFISEVERAQVEDFREMDNVPAVAWMLSKRAMRDVGMLDEHGPCFTKGGNGEDTAYVNRLKEAGWLVGVLNEDVATHLDGY